MTATPDAFSTADLEAMLADAPLDITDYPKQETEDERKARIIDIASELVNSLSTNMSDDDAAILHKTVLHMIVSHMIGWHTTVSESNFNDDETRSAICWARDAGKFQAILCILDTIRVSDDDFTCTV